MSPEKTQTDTSEEFIDVTEPKLLKTIAVLLIPGLFFPNMNAFTYARNFVETIKDTHNTNASVLYNAILTGYDTSDALFFIFIIFNNISIISALAVLNMKKNGKTITGEMPTTRFRICAPKRASILIGYTVFMNLLIECQHHFFDLWSVEKIIQHPHLFMTFLIGEFCLMLISGGMMFTMVNFSSLILKPLNDS